MSEATESYLPEGRRLAHYEIGRPLGSGAMGTVYEAHDTSLDRTVAVKVLRPEVAEIPETVERFEREARAAARVNHANLGHIYFVGHEDGLRYFAMENVPGLTFDEHVTEHGPMELGAALDVLIQAARGLAAAHEAQVVHRDVKPTNLKLLPDGVVKVLDFGLAKSISGDADLTGGGRILGTPRYMSPEQCRGEKLDRRTDVYSLGLIGYFLLTGEHAFISENLGKLLDDQMNAPLPSVTERRPDLSSSVQRVLERLCTKNRDARPATMEEAVTLLESVRPRVLDLAPWPLRVTSFVIDIATASLVGAGLVTLAGMIGISAEPLQRLLIFAVAITALLGLELRGGATLGRRLANLRVVRTDGTPPSTRGLALRLLLTLPYLVAMANPFPVLWVDRIIFITQGAVWVAMAGFYFFLARKLPADLLTRTRVIYESPERGRERTSAA